MKILVCDDDEKRGQQTREQIKDASGHDAALLSAKSLSDAIEALIARAQAALAPTEPRVTTHDTCAFDAGFDVAILDNNLSDLRIAGARHTAESIAGYVRAFVDIPYIVSMNKNPHVDFDLRYLIGDYQTHADIALNGPHVANPALWTGNPAHAPDSFLPWYWPVLNDAAERRREQIRFVSQHFDHPILKALEFPRSASDSFSRHAKGALSPDAVNVSRITFKTFFEKTCRSLPIRRERETLSKTAASHSAAVRGVVSRVVAAELDRWMRRDLMGPQDLLIDVPHLLMRMPFLLGDTAHDVNRWNKAVIAKEPPYGLERKIYDSHVAHTRFTHQAWTKSPCFWWSMLKANGELSRMFFDKMSPWAEVLFCEDISLFRPSPNGTSGAPREFAAECEGTWNRRHVAHLKDKHYRPQSRLAT